MHRGLFLPMYQREALWISFKAVMDDKYALRVFAGGVNAISGRPWKVPETKNGKRIQDYVVTPDQKWLDGITSDVGIVSQFVAMPIGSGYTIEKQITGKEDLGGFQIEIIPEFPSTVRFWHQNVDGGQVQKSTFQSPHQILTVC